MVNYLGGSEKERMPLPVITEVKSLPYSGHKGDYRSALILEYSPTVSRATEVILDEEWKGEEPISTYQFHKLNIQNGKADERDLNKIKNSLVKSLSEDFCAAPI